MKNRALSVLNYIYEKKIESLYPQICVCMRIFLAIPVSVASGERSFSKLALIKNCSRSTMSKERLASVMMISIERKLVRQIDYENLIDTVEIVSTGVQGDLNSLYEYARKNHLVPHLDKTKVVIFHKKRQIIEDRPLLTLGENVVEYVNSYKCLGFTLDESLQYDLHVKDICRKMNYGIQIIKRVKFYLPKCFY